MRGDDLIGKIVQASDGERYERAAAFDEIFPALGKFPVLRFFEGGEPVFHEPRFRVLASVVRRERVFQKIE